LFVVTLGSKIAAVSSFPVVYIGNRWQQLMQTISMQCCAPLGWETLCRDWLRSI